MGTGLSNQPDPSNHHLSRRGFLRAGAITAGMTAIGPAAAGEGAPSRDLSCIFLFLTGGPSHLDTWDPKPDAPAEVRGPFAPIATSVPSIRIAETFPCMAALSHRFTIVRSVHHRAAPVHETGQQLLQTGRLSRAGQEHPHVGAVLSQRLGPRRPGVPAWVILPQILCDTGLNVYQGQGPGLLGTAHAPAVLNPANCGAAGAAWKALDVGTEPAALRDRYGRTGFGENCLRARGLIEAGVRYVTVNMFDSVFEQVTWDCHADGRFLRSGLDDYRRTLGPTFDHAFTALIEDLHQRGMLDATLVFAAGEFGRTPRLNPGGGRDHWPGVWSVLIAGGGMRGGCVIGSSDKFGFEPASRPVQAQDVAATVYRAFGIDPRAGLPAAGGRTVPLTDGVPIPELFA
jgi:uncharacterized protein (DUF1501 family)